MRYTLQNGWIEQAASVPSSNCDPRPVGVEPDLLVIHNISLPPGEYGGDCVERFFTNCLDWAEHPFFEQIRDVRVSAHLLIRRTGDLIQFVNLADRAWHAGCSSFKGRDQCNDFSVGIELEGTDDEAYTEQQYQVLALVTHGLFGQYSRMNSARIVGHSDISPGRKTDPGPAFDWLHYRALLGQSGDL
ncbi:MAG: 1,6-anhydro-N-acetylmuramyl-L-alanine amidase AmpD [Halieaceae bacterium]|jgi:N-acetyl-anhydromuramoyl-L-alanine amidase|nr:1,6-anhydro-N-acetylmuramyl-L-alanine amidase AmpD [Halieaceae bacterium]